MEADAAEERTQEAADERVKQILALRADKRNVRVAWSAFLCAANQYRGGALDEIAAQKKYARLGAGVVDLQELKTLQDQIRQADEMAARARSEAREHKLGTLIGCSNPVVEQMSECFDLEGEVGNCGDLRAQLVYEDLSRLQRQRLSTDANKVLPNGHVNVKAILRDLEAESRSPKPRTP